MLVYCWLVVGKLKATANCNLLESRAFGCRRRKRLAQTTPNLAAEICANFGFKTEIEAEIEIAIVFFTKKQTTKQTTAKAMIVAVIARAPRKRCGQLLADFCAIFVKFGLC